MSCWCGHGPWHHCGPGYGPGGYGPGYGPPGYGPGYGPPGYGPGYGPPGYGPPGSGYGPGRRGRRRARAEDLEEYLAELEDEIAAVRVELQELRRRDAPS